MNVKVHVLKLSLQDIDELVQGTVCQHFSLTGCCLIIS